ncbi:MAG: type 1 glutamine amidotransferase [Acidobacteria bacterium]|nr:type 1 glutamine amidotransferase [Acidobacteriota bacterium]
MASERRRVGILVEDFYQELEVWYPLLRLREAGVEVFTLGLQAGTTYKSKLGYPVKADHGIDDISPTDLDAIVIPGGWAPDYMRRHPGFVNLVREMNVLHKTIAAICHAGWLLCSADILHGRRATSFFSIKADMIHAGAKWVDEACVVDGNLITSRTPEDLPAFCQALLAALAAGVREPAAARR